MSDENYDVKYDLKNATLHQSAVGDYANVNNHIPAQAAAANEGLAELKILFEQVNQRLAALEEADRKMITPTVEQMVEAASTVQQGDESEEKLSFLETRLKNLYLMRQDIGEVVISTLASPGAGVAIALQKIAQKAKNELNINEE